MKRLIIGAIAAFALTACSSQSSEPAVPVVTGSNGSDASVVVLVDCGEDGVAGVHVRYGTGPDEDVLIGRNPTTRSVGGLDTFSSNYGTMPDYPDTNLTVTTSPSRGTCKTTLTDYNSGDVIAERETAGKVTLGAIVSAKESKRSG
jgi:hypothetical protein